MNKPNVVFIVGPTAAGKSDIGCCLAKRINGEIISCDSMQIYREITIASDKPDGQIRKKVPHHCLDIASVYEDFDVVKFAGEASRAAESIFQTGKVPVVVGGSGMYYSVLVDGIFEGAKRDDRVRQRLQEEAKEKGWDHLYARLKKVDTAAAGKIHPNDQKRIIRALEVYALKDKPISRLQEERRGWADEYSLSVFGITMEREELYRRINERVDQMFDAGLLEEVRSLDRGRLSRTAQALIGIKEVHAFLDGQVDLETAKEKMKQNTRHFAKRQLTWFRRDKRIQWILRGPNTPPENIVDEITKALQDRPHDS